MLQFPSSDEEIINQSEGSVYECIWMLLTLLTLCDSGAGCSSRCHDRGVPSRPPEPQLECPESCALSQGEGIQ